MFDRIKDAYGWAVKKVEDHPGAVVVGTIGGVVGWVAGPMGSAAGASIGVSIGNTLDQPKPGDTPKK